MNPRPRFPAPPPLRSLSVDEAFNWFLLNSVDLQAADVTRARGSQDFLVKQIVQGGMFPPPSGRWLPSGSFARRTKTTRIDDIDLLLLFDGAGTVYYETIWPNYSVQVTPPNPLMAATNKGWLNSTSLLFDLRNFIQSLGHYKRSEVRKDMQVVNIELASTPWSFDIAPAIPVECASGDAFLIPNGYGQWIMTDPRRDLARIDVLDKNHSGRLRRGIRALKYWNLSVTPSLDSYYVETLVCRVFAGAPPSGTVREYVARFFANVEPYLLAACADPKDLGRDLDYDVRKIDKLRYRAAIRRVAPIAARALMFERAGQHVRANAAWRLIFGKEYPIYG